MKTCPNNPNHDEFITTAHVMQDWKVDGSGEFLEVVDESVQTSHGPNVDNIWECSVCGAEAVSE